MGEHFAPLKAQTGESVQAWFAHIAQRLLNETTLQINDQPYRLREIEFYYHGPGHTDPFAHNDPMQKETCRWYFHREGGSYRGGSFKGLDISFGSGEFFGGILLRSISGPGDIQINGSCLCVNHMLDRTGFERVAGLDGALGGCNVWEKGPIYLAPAPDLQPLPHWSTARVGLTLKRAYQHSEMPAYLMAPYRFPNEPRWIKKGKMHHVIALYQQGTSLEDINAATKTPKGTIKRYIEAYQEGFARKNLRPFWGKSLNNQSLAHIHGGWSAQFGTGTSL